MTDHGPRNKFVVFQSDRQGDRGVFRRLADGTGTVEQLTTPAKGIEHIPEDWAPVGDRLAMSIVSPEDVELWIDSRFKFPEDRNKPWLYNRP